MVAAGKTAIVCWISSAKRKNSQLRIAAPCTFLDSDQSIVRAIHTTMSDLLPEKQRRYLAALKQFGCGTS